MSKIENANWNFPTQIKFGLGRVRDLYLSLKEMGVKNPLIVTDPQLRENDCSKKVIKNFDDMNNKNFELFAGDKCFLITHKVFPNTVVYNYLIGS